MLGTLEDHVDPALPGEAHRGELTDPGAHVEEDKVRGKNMMTRDLLVIFRIGIAHEHFAKFSHYSYLIRPCERALFFV